MKRVTANESDDLANVLSDFLKELKDVDVSTVTISKTPNGPFESAELTKGHTISSLGFKNGEILFLNFEELQPPQVVTEATSGSVAISGTIPISQPSKELEVDELLDKEEGLIERKRDKLCKHNDLGMCEYCSPLPPWDKSYLEENQIKHSSFHSYVKKLNHQTNKETGGSYIKPLESSNYKINKNCQNGHEPWPKGICSKCQPSAITLQQQEYRMVDHLEFVNSEIVNNFIESWRRSGTQRIGVLYGKYKKYEKVPLGIKGVVEAIYEPTQFDENDGLTLNPSWEEEVSKVDLIAEKAGLYKLGVIFTDLTDAGNGDGSVICKRHKDSYFLTSLEVIFAAKLQSKNPNATKYSSTGKFGSKFVTCVISGNQEGEIDIQSYQVSESAQALVEADIITGSTQPSMAFINETNKDRYVPEVFYNKVNEYNLQVKVNAKPAFPVEYLLTTLSHGFPQDPSTVESTFNSNSFPIENRQALGTSQDFHELQKHLKIDSFNVQDIIESLSDFHLLLYLSTLEILSENELSLAIKASTEKKLELVYQLVEQPGWLTLSTILSSS